MIANIRTLTALLMFALIAMVKASPIPQLGQATGTNVEEAVSSDVTESTLDMPVIDPDNLPVPQAGNAVAASSTNGDDSQPAFSDNQGGAGLLPEIDTIGLPE
ncbi:hypothetical protein DFS34DRAFT_595749 [Phlyctochytrium arcticum]|nr:hypothetical protein DFS34DRAFT_595749 [Phlyctochytrium arcticum]